MSHLTGISFASCADRFDRAAGGERIWAVLALLRRDARDVVALGGHCEGVGVLASSAAFLVVAGGSPPPFMATKAFGVRLSRRALLVPVDRPARFGPRMRTRTDLDTAPRLAPFPSPLQPADERPPARPIPSPNPLSGKKSGPLTNF